MIVKGEACKFCKIGYYKINKKTGKKYCSNFCWTKRRKETINKMIHNTIINKIYNKIYDLQAEEILPKCIEGKNHFFITISKPLNLRSGIHIEKCKFCGVRQKYDTSD